MKLLILEESVSGIDPTRFDKIVSFCRDGFTNVEAYYTYAEYFKLYDEIYDVFQDWISANSASGRFRFEGLNVFLAYGKTTFDYIFNLYQKVYLLKRIIAVELPDELFLISPPQGYLGAKYPCLSSFAADFLPANVSLCYLDAGVEFKPKIREHCGGSSNSFDVLFDIIRHVGNRLTQNRRKRYLVYSDLSKISELFNCINGREIVFLGKTAPKRYLSFLLRKGIKIVLFRDFVATDRVSVCDCERVFRDRLDSDILSLIVGGIDLSPYAKRYLKALWEIELEQTLTEAQQLRSLFSSNRFESLLLDEDRSVTKNLVAQEASLRGCKSFVNCHGDPAHKIGYLPLTADKIFVWGRQQRDLFLSWGLNDQRILVAGCSKYDEYLHWPEAKARGKVCRDLKLKPDFPLIVLATCPLKERRNILDAFFWRDIKRIITEVLPFNDRCNLVFKLHPGDDNGQSITDLVTRILGHGARIITSYDPLLLAKASDALVIYLSTFLIDGLAYRKPVILGATYDLNRLGHLRYFYDGTTSEKLRESLENILYRRTQQHIKCWSKAADYILNGMDGQASKRIAAAMNLNLCVKEAYADREHFSGQS